MSAANLFRIDRFPLGYLPVFFHWGMYGLILGTNSFGVVRDRPTVPSINRLVSSTGFLEIGAYTLLASATTGIWLYRQRSWTRWRTERVRDLSDARLTPLEVGASVLAAVLLIYGAAREASGLGVWPL